MRLAINSEQLKTAVVGGDRPSLSEITGHANLVSFAKKWIPRCWHKSPDKRPTFGG